MTNTFTTCPDCSSPHLATDKECPYCALVAAQHDHASVLDLLSRVRWALGDKGKRMQDEFLEFCAEPRDAKDFGLMCLEDRDWALGCLGTYQEAMRRIEERMEDMQPKQRALIRPLTDILNEALQHQDQRDSNPEEAPVLDKPCLMNWAMVRLTYDSTLTIPAHLTAGTQPPNADKDPAGYLRWAASLIERHGVHTLTACVRAWRERQDSTPLG